VCLWMVSVSVDGECVCDGIMGVGTSRGCGFSEF